MSLEYKFENRGTVQVRPTGIDKRSPCCYVVWALIPLIIIIGAWLFFRGYLTPASATDGSHVMSLRGQMNEQEQLIAKQADNIKTLEEQLATAKRELQVQVSANEDLSKKMAVASVELGAEKDKTVLYQGIMNPADLEQGLHIQSFAIKPRLVDEQGKKVESLYHYHLVLSLLTKGGEETQNGSYSIVITGKQEGKSVTVTQKDVTPANEKTLSSFSVKHYQSLEGNLQFPKNFTPETVKLRVSPASGETPERLIKSYDWAAFMNAEAPKQQE